MNSIIADKKESTLNRNERDSLFFLVFLYMRIGRLDEARQILENLKTVCPEEARTGKYLAAIALEQADAKLALGHLASLLDQNEIKTQDAPLLLLQAKAQWISGNEAESRAIVNEYLAMAGGDK